MDELCTVSGIVFIVIYVSVLVTSKGYPYTLVSTYTLHTYFHHALTGIKCRCISNKAQTAVTLLCHVCMFYVVCLLMKSIF